MYFFTLALCFSTVPSSWCINMETSLLLKQLGNSPKLKVIDFLIDNIGLDYSKKEIAKGAEISIMTLNRFWSELEESQIVSKTRKYGKAQLFTLNRENTIVKGLLKMEQELIKESQKTKVEVST